MNYTLEQCRTIHAAITNPQWRVWKAIVEGGMCLQCHVPISSPEKLYGFLKNKDVHALYVGISEFLNAHKNHGFVANQKVMLKDGTYTYRRNGYVTADCILLYTRFFVDLDSEGDINTAQGDARKIIREMVWYPEYTLESVQFSGKKGVHLIYSRTPIRMEDPAERMRAYRKEHQELAGHLASLNLKTIDKVHLNIMSDPFRVYAAPFSYKRHGQVTPLNPQQFMIIPLTALINPLASEAQANDLHVATGESPTHPYRGAQRARLSSHPISYRFVDGMVRGLRNNYITIIKKHNDRYSEESMRKLQKKYGLSDVYVFMLGDYTYAYSLKITQFERQVKILRASRSENLMYFITRRHTPLPVSDAIDAQGRIVHRIQFQKILHAQSSARMHAHSRPHASMQHTRYERMVGAEMNRTGTMVEVE